MGLPTTGYDWSDVLAGITDVLATPLVAAGTMFVLGLSFAPRVIRTFKRAIGTR